MIGRIAIAGHFIFGALTAITIFATNPLLAQKAALNFDRAILNLIELLYQLKNLG